MKKKMKSTPENLVEINPRKSTRKHEDKTNRRMKRTLKKRSQGEEEKKMTQRGEGKRMNTEGKGMNRSQGEGEGRVM